MKRLLLVALLLLSPISAFATNYSLDANCKVSWLFEEGSGTTVDDATSGSITGNFLSDGNPAWYNTTLPDTWSTWGVDFSSDTVTSSSTVGVAGLLSNKSYSFWINPDAIGRGVVFTRISASGGGYGEDIDLVATNAIQFRHASVSGTTLLVKSSNSTISTGVWQHIVITWDGSDTAANVHIYINGAETTYQTQTDGSSLAKGNTYNTVLGYNANYAEYYNGKIDDFAIFDDILSGAEIADIYANGLTGTAGGATSTSRRRIMIVE